MVFCGSTYVEGFLVPIFDFMTFFEAVFEAVFEVNFGSASFNVIDYISASEIQIS